MWKCPPSTVKKYVQILKALYIVFQVTPYSKNIARSLLKEPKIYFFDTGLFNGAGKQFENLMAVSLLKHLYGRSDAYAEQYAPHYLRTKDGEEVDFTIVKDGKVDSMIEAKVFDEAMSPTLLKFHKKYGHKASQVVKNAKRDHQTSGIEILGEERVLSDLSL